jgi:catalase
VTVCYPHHFRRCILSRCLGVSVVRKALLGLDGLNFATTDTNKVVSSYAVVTTGTYDIGSFAADALRISAEEKGWVSLFAYELSKHRCYERELDGLASQVAF